MGSSGWLSWWAAHLCGLYLDVGAWTCELRGGERRSVDVVTLSSVNWPHEVVGEVRERLDGGKGNLLRLGVLGEEIFGGKEGQHIGVGRGVCWWAWGVVWGAWGLKADPWKS